MEEEYYQIEDDNGWQSVFQRLHQISRVQAGSQTDAKKPSNIPRNRYRDVLPIDSTRVKLNDVENDYINANFVKIDDVKRSYILTQGPLQHTFHHFWQMVWEQKTAGIVMLNRCVERGMNKCYQYWPRGLDEPTMEFSSFKVELISIEDMYSFHLSTLRLENTETEESRIILHFHYTKWPDFGVPRTADDFLDFLDAVRKSGVLNEDVGPCVVHCSAGIGRTGTFCLVDVCLKKFEETGDIGSIDIQPILLDMRKQRLGLIQTADQLRFSYIAFLQSVLVDSEEEDQVEGSDSEEVEDEEESVKPMENGSSGIDIYKDHRFESDLPPPIPPRYPDMLENRSLSPSPSPSPPPPPQSQPPPPPQTLPPGPPEYINNDDDNNDDDIEELLLRYQKPNSQEDVSNSEEEDQNENEDKKPKEAQQSWYMNGIHNNEAQWLGNLHEEDDREDDIPPSPPPRVQSAKKSQSPSDGEDHFLGIGRGGERSNQDLPPPLPPSKPSRGTVSLNNLNEEQALIDELNELERLVSQPGSTTALKSDEETEEDSTAKELRRRLREDRQTRLQEKVTSMQVKLKQQDTKEWSVPWLVVGIVVIIGYCAYVVFSS